MKLERASFYLPIFYQKLTKKVTIDKILSMIELVWKTSEERALEIAQRLKKRRKEKKLTQKELARRSGVSYGSLKRFEQTGKIELTSLIDLANALYLEEDFDSLFARKGYASIQEVIDEND